MCVQARPELHVFLLEEWRDIGRNKVENRWNMFFGTCFLERVFWNVKRVPWNAKKRTRAEYSFFGGTANRKLTPLTGI